MLSHDLAKELLARRNNDVRIEVLIDDDPDSVRDIWATRVELRDGGSTRGSGYAVASEDVVTYDPETDVLLIRAAAVVLGDPR